MSNNKNCKSSFHKNLFCQWNLLHLIQVLKERLFKRFTERTEFNRCFFFNLVFDNWRYVYVVF